MSRRSATNYEQSLLDRVTSLTSETNNLRDAYLIVNKRLNKLLFLAAASSKQLIEEASRVEDFSRLAVEAARMTEQSALITKNDGLIDAAKKSTVAATAVHTLAIELRTIKLAKLAINHLDSEI